jgi:hypothetical protein
VETVRQVKEIKEEIKIMAPDVAMVMVLAVEVPQQQVQIQPEAFLRLEAMA